MKSLQTRLIVGVAAVFSSGFLLAAIAIYVFSKASMFAEFDEALHATAQALANLTEESSDGIEFESTDGFEEFTRTESPAYFQFWLNGKSLRRSARLRGHDLELAQGESERPTYSSVTLPDGRGGRQIYMTFYPDLDWDDDWDDDGPSWSQGFSRAEPGHPEVHAITSSSPELQASSAPSENPGVMTLTWERSQPDVAIAVARATTEIDRSLANLMWILTSVGSAITLLSSGVLFFVVRNGLQPVQAVTQAINSIDEHTLSDRVPTNRVPIEISPLVERVNDLLVRLESAFERERAFSSSLAHELRTPLAGLRSTLEVYHSRRHEPEEYDRAISVCLQICAQSESLVENLLSLARIEATTFECQFEHIVVSELFEACWVPMSAKAKEREINTAFDVTKLSVKTDRELLRVILRNVLSNAVCHCDEGGQIEAVLRRIEGELVMTVSNTGNQLSEAQARRAFDRLWRGDSARSQTGEHFGLGLTLIKRFAEALGGTATVHVDSSFHISVTLPV